MLSEEKKTCCLYCRKCMRELMQYFGCACTLVSLLWFGRYCSTVLAQALAMCRVPNYIFSGGPKNICRSCVCAKFQINIINIYATRSYCHNLSRVFRQRVNSNEPQNLFFGSVCVNLFFYYGI